MSIQESLITPPSPETSKKSFSLVVEIAKAMNELGIDPKMYCPIKTKSLVQQYLSISQLCLCPLANNYHQEKYYYVPLLIKEPWSKELEEFLRTIHLKTPPEIELEKPIPAVLFSNFDGKSMKEGKIEPIKVELAQLMRKHKPSGEIIASVYPLCQAPFGTTQIQASGSESKVAQRYISVTSRSILSLYPS